MSSEDGAHRTVTSDTRRATQRKALDAYVSAADVALAVGKNRYTWQISELASALGDADSLDRAFQRFLANTPDASSDMYVTNLDYARALVKFADPRSDYYFQESIKSRDALSSLEAYYHYASYMRDTGRPNEAFALLEKFDASDRQQYLELLLLRQQLAHAIGIDTTDIDAEVEIIREALNGTLGIGPIPKPNARAYSAPANRLNLPAASAQPWAHLSLDDDSRNWLGSGWNCFTPNPGSQVCYSDMVVNLAEILWNEARGETTQAAKVAVQWTVRNRATISMHLNNPPPGRLRLLPGGGR